MATFFSFQPREFPLPFPTLHGTARHCRAQTPSPSPSNPPIRKAAAPPLAMAGEADGWELLLAAEPYTGEGEAEEGDAGAIKHDYFELGSGAKYSTERASLEKGDGEGEKEEELLAASDNASWVEPDPDDLAFPARDRATLWSDSSSDGERHEAAAAAALDKPWGSVKPLPQEEEAAADEGAVAKGGAAAAARWWKMPLEVLRLWALRAARSAWSVPVAVALLGMAVLGRRLYRMRRQSKAVARVRLALDDKKASQFKAQAARMNESNPMARRAAIAKPLLPANGVTPWPVLGHM